MTVTTDSTPTAEGTDRWAGRTIRNSYRYRVIPAVTRLAGDIVFADNPDEAERRGRQVFEIPANETVDVVRVRDVEYLPSRMN